MHSYKVLQYEMLSCLYKTSTGCGLYFQLLVVGHLYHREILPLGESHCGFTGCTANTLSSTMVRELLAELKASVRVYVSVPDL